jgi:hypothetical protein
MLLPIDPADDHGHVRPKSSGSVARCGGPALCGRCQREWYEVHGTLHPSTHAATIFDWTDKEWKLDRVVAFHLASQLGPVVMTAADVLAVVKDDIEFEVGTEKLMIRYEVKTDLMDLNKETI